jgi:hypothetical protein
MTLGLQEAPMSSDVQFTHAQKWDLLRMSGAAVVSTVFFGVPMFIARPERIPESRPAETRQAAEVSILVSETVAPVTTPAWEALPAKSALPTPSRRHHVARATAPSLPQRPVPSASGTTLARRLGRLLAGSGRYEVRPFPSLE